MPRHGGRALLVGLLLAWCAATPARAMSPAARQALLDQARAQGELPVIVRLAVPSPAPGEPPDEAAIAAATARLLAALGVAPSPDGSLAGPGIQNVKPFATIPYLALTADPAAIARLLAQPAVLTVEPDQPARVN